MITPRTRQPIELLFVCTANQCRSPMAEGIARYELTRRTIPGHVLSAGLVEGGRPAATGTIKAMADHGFDLTDHVSVQVSQTMVERADLILTMEGAHQLELSSRWPDVAERTLALEAAVAEVLERPPPAPLGPSDLRTWVSQADVRSLDQVLDSRWDVPDPMGGRPRGYRRTFELLRDSVTALFDGWFGKPPS